MNTVPTSRSEITRTWQLLLEATVASSFVKTTSAFQGTIQFEVTCEDDVSSYHYLSIQGPTAEVLMGVSASPRAWIVVTTSAIAELLTSQELPVGALRYVGDGDAVRQVFEAIGRAKQSLNPLQLRCMI